MEFFLTILPCLLLASDNDGRDSGDLGVGEEGGAAKEPGASEESPEHGQENLRQLQSPAEDRGRQRDLRGREEETGGDEHRPQVTAGQRHGDHQEHDGRHFAHTPPGTVN